MREERLVRDRESHLDNRAGHLPTVVDPRLQIRLPVRIGLVHRPKPSKPRTGLLDVAAHNNLQRVGDFAFQLLELLSVFEDGLVRPGGTGADDEQLARIFSGQDITNLLPVMRDLAMLFVGERKSIGDFFTGWELFLDDVTHDINIKKNPAPIRPGVCEQIYACSDLPNRQSLSEEIIAEKIKSVSHVRLHFMFKEHARQSLFPENILQSLKLAFTIVQNRYIILRTYLFVFPHKININIVPMKHMLRLTALLSLVGSYSFVSAACPVGMTGCVDDIGAKSAATQGTTPTSANMLSAEEFNQVITILKGIYKNGNVIQIGSETEDKELQLLGKLNIGDTEGETRVRARFDGTNGSFAAGTTTSASSTEETVGAYSARFGNTTRASGEASFAAGQNATASGARSFSMGSVTTASGLASVAMGTASQATGEASFAIGDYVEATGKGSFAAGTLSKSTNTASVALGNGTYANGMASFAAGSSSEANGDFSFAAGSRAIADNEGSVAIGTGATTSAPRSVSLGHGTSAVSENAVAIGAFNVGKDGTLFEVGSGVDAENRSNAFTIRKSGEVGIGTDYPLEPLHVVLSNGLVLLRNNNAWQDSMPTNGIVLGMSSDENIPVGFGLRDDDEYDFAVYLDSTDHTLNIASDNNGTTAKDLMTFDTYGKIGIGTAAPTAKLEIKSTANWHAPTLLIGAETIQNPTVLKLDRLSRGRWAGLDLSTSGATDWYVGTTYNAGVSESGFSIGKDFNRSTAKFYIDPDGKVGIGTATPQSELDVNGKVMADQFCDAESGQCMWFYSDFADRTEWAFHAAGTPEEVVESFSTHDYTDIAGVGITKMEYNGESHPIINATETKELFFRPGGNGYIHMYGPGDENDSTARFLVHSDTYLPKSYMTPISGGRFMSISSDGKVGYYSSARRYKKNIVDMDDTSWIYDLRPVEFDFKENDVHDYGLIAEEVEEVNPEFVFYNNYDGQITIEGVHYQKLIPVLLKEIQVHKNTIDDLQARLEALEAGE